MSELISWIRGFLTTLYVSAIIKDGKCCLFSRAIKGDKIVNSNEAVFDIGKERYGTIFEGRSDHFRSRYPW